MKTGAEHRNAGRERPESPDRPRAFPLPREHGGWALLYGPFAVITLTLGRFDARTLLLFLTLTLLFLAHEPLSRLARMNLQATPSRRRYWWQWLGLYLAGSAASGTILIWAYQLRLLWIMGALVLLLLALHILLIKRRQEKSLLGEALGVVGLTSSVPVGYYIMLEVLDQNAWTLWVLNILYFSSAIFYVKMMVCRHVPSKKEEAVRRSRHCVLYHTALAAAIALLAWRGWMSFWLLLPFVPITLRAFAGTFSGERRLNLKRIGYTEVAHTVVFVGLLVGIWRATN